MVNLILCLENKLLSNKETPKRNKRDVSMTEKLLARLQTSGLVMSRMPRFLQEMTYNFFQVFIYQIFDIILRYVLLALKIFWFIIAIFLLSFF